MKCFDYITKITTEFPEKSTWKSPAKAKPSRDAAAAHQTVYLSDPNWDVSTMILGTTAIYYHHGIKPSNFEDDPLTFSFDSEAKFRFFCKLSQGLQH